MLAMTAFVGAFFAYTDFQLDSRGLLPLEAAWVFLGALMCVSLGTVFRASASAATRTRLVSLYAAHVSVLVPLAGIVLFSILSAFLPHADWDQGPRYAMYPAYDAVIVVLSMLLAFEAHHRRRFRAYLTVALLLVVGGVVFEALHPGTFSNVESRAAGFAGNPNTAAFLALTLCCATLDFTRPRVRDLALLALTMVGVLATLSRGGMAMAAFLLLCYAASLAMSGYVRPRRIVGAILAGAVLVGLTYAAAAALIQRAAIFELPSQTRIEMFLGHGGVVSEREYRLQLLEDAWRLVHEAPLLGYGSGFTYSLPQGPHNIYLQQWVNNGIGGLACYVWLLAAAIRLFWRRRSRSGLVFMGLVAIEGLFSHNLLEERAFLALLGLSLTMSFYSAAEVEPFALPSRPVRRTLTQRAPLGVN